MVAQSELFRLHNQIERRNKQINVLDCASLRHSMPIITLQKPDVYSWESEDWLLKISHIKRFRSACNV